MTDQELDRVRCAALFGLDESDLEEQPFDGHAYWYEGVPEWAADDFDRDERNSPSGRFRTLIIPCLDGKPQVPEGFRLVKLYRSAAECECPWCGPKPIGFEFEMPQESCKLCEGDGLLYWGEEWCECVIEKPLYDSTCTHDPAEGQEFLGTMRCPMLWADNLTELWRDERNGDVTWTAVYADDWPNELIVPERMLRHNPKLREALPWLAIAEQRWKAQQEK